MHVEDHLERSGSVAKAMGVCGDLASRRRCGGRLGVLRLSAAAALSCVALASVGCQHGGRFAFNPIGRAMARQEVRSAESLLAEGRLGEAASAYQSAIEHDPESAEAHAGWGDMLSGRKEHLAAIRHYREAVRLAPEDIGHAMRLARGLREYAPVAMDRERVWTAAAKAYLHAWGLAPGNLGPALGVAMCYRQLGRDREAVAILERERIRRPRYSGVYIALARQHEHMNDAEAAMEAYDVALRIEPDNVIAHNGVGRLYARQVDRGSELKSEARERAVAHLRRSLELDSDQPPVRRMLSSLEPIGATAVAGALDEAVD